MMAAGPARQPPRGTPDSVLQRGVLWGGPAVGPAPSHPHNPTHPLGFICRTWFISIRTSCEQGVCGQNQFKSNWPHPPLPCCG